MLNRIDANSADRIIESLRFGVPPSNVIKEFTVGREDQIEELEQTLDNSSSDRGGALLVNANYGSGKSHLLEVLRKTAIDAGYVVSHVVVSAQNGVRFNRMDSIFGEVSRQLEVDGSGRRGVGALFDALNTVSPSTLSADARRIKESIVQSERWGYSDYLKSPGIQIAIRAWSNRGADVRDLVEDWLCNPYNFRGQRKLLFKKLVADISGKFRDVPPEWRFYADESLVFHTRGHKQAWDALCDYDLIAKIAGFRGLVLLFDEFEDVIQGLVRRNYQEQAYLNLFQFFGGRLFPGMAYFAVTPDFIEKCKRELVQRGVYDFDFEQFDDLPQFQLNPITDDQFLELAFRIRSVHSLAYDWEAGKAIPDDELRDRVGDLLSVPSPDRVRSAIQGIVESLDELLEDS